MATKKYLDYAGLKRVLAKLLPGARKIWHGTLAEWEALSATEKAKYDQAEVIDEYTGVPVVVDKVESGNLNPVTSNAVAVLTTEVKQATAVMQWTNNSSDNITLTFKRIGNIVSVHGISQRNTTGTVKGIGAWTDVCTIPEGFRPNQRMMTHLETVPSGSGSSEIMLDINTYGSIKQYSFNNVSPGYEKAVNLTYIVDA